MPAVLQIICQGLCMLAKRVSGAFRPHKRRQKNAPRLCRPRARDFEKKMRNSGMMRKIFLVFGTPLERMTAALI